MTAPACMSVASARAALGVSEATLYRLLKARKLARTKCGTRTLIRVDELRRYLDENTKGVA